MNELINNIFNGNISNIDHLSQDEKIDCFNLLIDKTLDFFSKFTIEFYQHNIEENKTIDKLIELEINKDRKKLIKSNMRSYLIDETLLKKQNSLKKAYQSYLEEKYLPIQIKYISNFLLNFDKKTIKILDLKNNNKINELIMLYNINENKYFKIFIKYANSKLEKEEFQRILALNIFE